MKASSFCKELVQRSNTMNEKKRLNLSIPLPSGQGLGRLARWFIPNGGTLVILALFFFAQTAGAISLPARQSALNWPSATTINYQGRLANSSGIPINDTMTLQFAFYDSNVDGELLWGPETHPNVPVSDGLFSVALGGQTSGGVPTDVLVGDIWLEITVDGETLSPREQLRAVPYAMQAGVALTVPDGAIGTEQITYGAITSDSIADNAVKSGEIATGAVGSDEVADNSLTSSDLAANSVKSSEIASGAVTQVEAPTLVQADVSNTMMQYGKIWITAQEETDLLWVDIDFAPNFSAAPALILQPAITNDWLVVPTHGHCDDNGDKCRAFFHHSGSGTWSPGQFIEFSWIAVQQH
jgi:hypothetical protein